MNQVDCGNECAMMTDTTVIYNTDMDMLLLVLLQLHISNIVMPVMSVVYAIIIVTHSSLIP